MSNKKSITHIPSKIIYHIFTFFARFAYKKTKIHGTEQIPEGGSIIVANHAQLNGPIIAELCMPKNCYIWANGQMRRCRDVPKYAMADFFPYKSGLSRLIFRLACYPLAVLLPCVINNARVIPVYRDVRLASTFKASVKALSEGKNIVIFPECHEQYNNIINAFQENFVDVARLYHKRTGRSLGFVPMYIAPALKSCYIGETVSFNPEADISEERKRISTCLANSITDIGRSLPEHTVIPFDNISKKHYLSNKDIDSVPVK